MPIPPRLLALLTHPRLPVGLALVGMALSLPALAVGFQLDDYFHQVQIFGIRGVLDVGPSRQGMFGFIDADLARTRALREAGILPWWSTDELRAVFLRPVTEATHRLDYLFWPDSPALMHLHSLAWAALLVVLATSLFRAWLGATPVAGLAALLYAVDDARGVPIGWIANRNALVAATFGVAVLLLHTRARARGDRRAAILGPAVFAVGLLAGEACVAAAGWLFADALFLDRRPALARLKALAPHAVLVVAWRLAYDALGYGASGSGLYIDPGRDPARFAGAVLLRAPSLLSGAWLPIPSDFDVAVPDPARPAVAAALAAVLAALGVVVWRRVGADPRARFLATGMALSVVPVCATFPNDRLLTFVGLGAMGLVALFVLGPGEPGAVSDGPRGEAGVPAPPPAARPRSARLLALGLLAVHGAWAPLLLPVRVYSPVFLAGMFNPCIESAPKDAAIASQDLVIVNTNDFCAAYIPTFGVLHGWTLPRRVRNLAPGLGPVTVERLDARTLALSREGGFFSFGGEQLLRDPKADWQIGEPVEIGGVSYEVARLSERGLPEEFRVRFPVPLEDPSLRWMRQDGPTLRPFTPPEIGTPVEVLNGFQGF